MKKILLTLGTLAGLTVPVAAVISCSNDEVTPKTKTTNEINPATPSVLESQRERWIEQVKYSSMTQGEKDILTNDLISARTQSKLNMVGNKIAISLGMNWSPSGTHEVASNTIETPIGDWNLLKPVEGDDFTYDESTFELKADFINTDISDPAQWAKLYDAYFYLVSEAKNDILLTLTCKDDRSDKVSTVSYLTHAKRELNRMPSGIWEHFMTLIETRAHRGSISDLITGD